MRACLLFVSLILLVACSEDRRTGTADGGTIGVDGGTADAGGTPDAGPPDAGEPEPFTLTSSAYAEGETIPVRYECGPPVAEGPGDNASPPLAWTAGPSATMSYAIVMRDLDFENLVHWVLYDIPATARSIDEDVPAAYMPLFPDGAKQAELQGSGYFGYLGPCSPASVNTYQITLHALDTATLPGVGRTTTEDDIAAAVEAASIASASLSGES